MGNTVTNEAIDEKEQAALLDTLKTLRPAQVDELVARLGLDPSQLHPSSVAVSARVVEVLRVCGQRGLGMAQVEAAVAKVLAGPGPATAVAESPEPVGPTAAAGGAAAVAHRRRRCSSERGPRSRGTSSR